MATTPSCTTPSIGQRDVHRPVVAADLGELAGAVEGVDDPHPRPLEAHRVVDGFLGQHRVVGPQLGQSSQQELVRPLVTAVFQLLRIPPCSGALGSQCQQQLPGSVCECSRNVKIRCDHSTLRYNPPLYTRSRSPWRPRHQAVR